MKNQVRVDKVKSFKEIQKHPFVEYVDANDYDPKQHYWDRCAILIGLKDGLICQYSDCNIITAYSKKEAINRLNEICKNYNESKKETNHLNFKL